MHNTYYFQGRVLAYAMHIFLKIQVGVGALVSSQKRRATIVSVIGSAIYTCSRQVLN